MLTSKETIRSAATLARRDQRDKDGASATIIEHLLEMPVYRNCATPLWYVDIRDEVRTRDAIGWQIGGPKSVVIPYCVGDDLSLFRLHGWDDLEPGRFGILEPLTELRQDPERLIPPSEIDLVVVPGVAFDADGGRVGHGKGFYDRLLQRIPETAVKVGLAYGCQVTSRVPTEPHDAAMDWLVTEAGPIACQTDR